ncbi:hypothetical protein LguiA_026876 [Lonicera macranthoides]
MAHQRAGKCIKNSSAKVYRPLVTRFHASKEHQRKSASKSNLLTLTDSNFNALAKSSLVAQKGAGKKQRTIESGNPSNFLVLNIGGPAYIGRQGRFTALIEPVSTISSSQALSFANFIAHRLLPRLPLQQANTSSVDPSPGRTLLRLTYAMMVGFSRFVVTVELSKRRWIAYKGRESTGKVHQGIVSTGGFAGCGEEWRGRGSMLGE